MHKFITMTAFSGLLVSAMLATTPTLAQSSRSVINPTALQKKIAVILKMPHRSAKNRRRDRNRDPVRAMEFCRLKDNMKVLEWGPGRGWYTEILGVLLKDRGQLYASNRAVSLKRLNKLLKSPLMRAVKKLPVKVIRHPITHDITIDTLDFGMRDADMALNIREYHNLDMKTVDKFNAATYQALKPGGYYCIIDHTRRHMGPDANENRRRMDPVKIIKQVQDAGFKFVDYTNLFLRLDDELRFEVGRKTVRGNTDRFTLLFQKPQS